MRIGIDLGGTKTEVIALSDKGEELFRHRVNTPRDDYQATVQAIVDLVTLAEQKTGETGTVGLSNVNNAETTVAALKRKYPVLDGRPQCHEANMSGR